MKKEGNVDNDSWKIFLYSFSRRRGKSERVEEEKGRGKGSLVTQPEPNADSSPFLHLFSFIFPSPFLFLFFTSPPPPNISQHVLTSPHPISFALDLHSTLPLPLLSFSSSFLPLDHHKHHQTSAASIPSSQLEVRNINDLPSAYLLVTCENTSMFT